MQFGGYILAAATGVAGLVICAAFFLLEERNRTLVKISELPLKELESRIASATDIPSMEMLLSADMPTKGWKRFARYSWVIRAVMVAGFVLMLIGTVIALSGVFF